MADNRLLTKDQVGESPPDEQGQVDYSQLVLEEAFIGDTPYDTIVNQIEIQFNDYIQMEDTTNYVDTFYNQLHASYEAVNTDEEENHRQEILEALDRIQQEFIQFISDLFEQRLTISIMMLEAEDINYDDLEFILRRLYEFFILDAKRNFKVVICNDILPRVQSITNEDEFFKKVQELMLLYSPLIKTIKPTEFINMRGEKEMLELFENGQVAGNFLRKYSPKFYQNEEFQIEVINYITMVSQLGKEITDATE